MELYLEIVFADVTKLRCSHARLEWTPIQYDLCRNKKKRGRETKGRASWEDDARREDTDDLMTKPETGVVPL